MRDPAACIVLSAQRSAGEASNLGDFSHTACSVGAELAALAPQRVLETAGEEPEGQEPEPPRGSRRPVGRQWLVVLRHGQRIDEARGPVVIKHSVPELGSDKVKLSGFCCSHADTCGHPTVNADRDAYRSARQVL